MCLFTDNSDLKKQDVATATLKRGHPDDKTGDGPSSSKSAKTPMTVSITPPIVVFANSHQS